MFETYFDEKEDTTLASVIEKIRKLTKSSKVNFSQVPALLKISLTLYFIMLKNGQTYFKNLAVFTPQDF